MYFTSDQISSISPQDTRTWKKKVFFTFDVDWAHDEVIADTLALVGHSGHKSTWFATHDADYLQSLFDSDLVEVGVHPNFNNLLNNNSVQNSGEIIMHARSIVPDGTSLRSHSLMQSERLIDEFSAAGFTHISNLFVPYASGLRMIPFRLWDGVTIVPYQFQDNVEIKMNLNSMDNSISEYEFHVFNFHPIHVFLNTESLDRYEKTRPLHQNPKELIKYRYKGFGTRNRLIRILNLFQQP